MAAASSFMPTTTAGAGPAADPWPGLVAASLGIAASRLAVFSRLMSEHGFAVESSRLFFDPIYAYRRLALAHTSSDDDLKTLAVELFERYKQLERRRHSVSAFSRPH